MAAHVPAPIHPEAAGPSLARGAAFDALYEQLTGPASIDTTNEAYEADLLRLRTLLPAGDKARDVRFRALFCASEIWTDTKRGLAYADEALRLARDARDVPSQARAMFCRSDFVRVVSGTRHSVPEMDRAIALLEDGTQPQLLAEALEVRGDTLSLLGEQAKAMLDFQRARVAYRAAGINHDITTLLLSTAITYRRMGDWPQAQRNFMTAMARMRELQDWYGVSTCMVQLGYLFGQSGSAAKSLAWFREAEVMARKHDFPQNVHAALIGMSESQIRLGLPQEALSSLKSADAIQLSSELALSEDRTHFLRGLALAKLGRHADALELYSKSMPIVERNGNQRYMANLYEAQATSHEALGHTTQALVDYKRFIELQQKLQGKMRLEQGLMLEYETEIRRREFENRQLRQDAEARQHEVTALQAVRRWQWLAIALGSVLIALLTSLAWRQRLKSRKLHDLTLLDPLTGIANRPGIEHEAATALEDAQRENKPLSLLMLDLDHFKAINDNYGHAAGDKVLRAATAAWQGQLRGQDPLGRIGGEEFVVVCRDTTLEQSILLADRLRDATAALRFEDVAPTLRLTVSIGAAQALRTGDSCDGLLDRADAALYRAKQRGRNRVEA